MADVHTCVTLKVKYPVYWTFRAAVLLNFQIISLANGSLNISIVNGEEKSPLRSMRGDRKATERKHRFLIQHFLI